VPRLVPSLTVPPPRPAAACRPPGVVRCGGPGARRARCGSGRPGPGSSAPGESGWRRPSRAGRTVRLRTTRPSPAATSRPATGPAHRRGPPRIRPAVRWEAVKSTRLTLTRVRVRVRVRPPAEPPRPIPRRPAPSAMMRRVRPGATARRPLRVGRPPPAPPRPPALRPPASLPLVISPPAAVPRAGCLGVLAQHQCQCPYRARRRRRVTALGHPGPRIASRIPVAASPRRAFGTGWSAGPWRRSRRDPKPFAGRTAGEPARARSRCTVLRRATLVPAAAPGGRYPGTR
jgi:hypothetical protein